MAQFVGYDLVKSKKNNKIFCKCYFLNERIENDYIKGYSVFDEFIPFDSDVVALLGQEVELIYSKNYRGMAVLQAVKPLGKD